MTLHSLFASTRARSNHCEGSTGPSLLEFPRSSDTSHRKNTMSATGNPTAAAAHNQPAVWAKLSVHPNSG